jgi:hypothetical protein
VAGGRPQATFGSKAAIPISAFVSSKLDRRHLRLGLAPLCERPGEPGRLSKGAKLGDHYSVHEDAAAHVAETHRHGDNQTTGIIL